MTTRERLALKSRCQKKKVSKMSVVPQATRVQMFFVSLFTFRHNVSDLFWLYINMKPCSTQGNVPKPEFSPNHMNSFIFPLQPSILTFLSLFSQECPRNSHRLPHVRDPWTHPECSMNPADNDRMWQGAEGQG